MNCWPQYFSEGATASKADCIILKVQELLSSNPRYGTSEGSKTTVERCSVIYVADIVHQLFLDGKLNPFKRAD
jgi:hypothetical protein